MSIHNKRIKKLISTFQQYCVDGYIVPSYDEFRNEYAPEYLKRLEWLVGFSGSNGLAVITQKNLLFFTDSRYIIQASNELDTKFQIIEMGKDQFSDMHNSLILGYDPAIESQESLLRYHKLLNIKSLKLQSIEQNLIDLLWHNKPQRALYDLISLTAHEAGTSSQKKLHHLIQSMDQKADYYFTTKPDAICWLLNIRGRDIEFSPLLLSYLIVSRDGECYLFSDSISDHIDNVCVLPFQELKNFFINIIISGCIIQTHKDIPIWAHDIGCDHIIMKDDLIALHKASKNETEIQYIKDSHIMDGIALCKFICWLYDNWGKATELSASDALLQIKQQCSKFIEPSFATISASGMNGAIIHYRCTESTNRQINADDIYLIDSGSQYKFGTTDVTRTFCFGNPSLIQKRNYTLVLKGMIRLSEIKFPIGTTGAQLDALARLDLWEHGLDYGHGTGHGVGYFLSVHEGPQSISKSSLVPLKCGMILSNEPGYYEHGKYGIRIENMMLVKNSEQDGFLEFETLTLAPITNELIDYTLLNTKEKEWLKNYNSHIMNILDQHLNDEEKNRLQILCNS